MVVTAVKLSHAFTQRYFILTQRSPAAYTTSYQGYGLTMVLSLMNEFVHYQPLGRVVQCSLVCGVLLER